MGIWLWLYKLGEASIRSTKLKHVKKWLDSPRRGVKDSPDRTRPGRREAPWGQSVLGRGLAQYAGTHKVPNEWLVIMTPLIPRNQLFLSLSLSLASPPLPPPYISRGGPRTKQSRLLRPRPPPVDPNTLEEDLITTSPFEREIWFSLVGVDTLLFGKN